MEGITVRIQCNVSTTNLPNGAAPIRYEWKDPNGTVIGTQWELRLARIQLSESGLYVCGVSSMVGDERISASMGTIINVTPYFLAPPGQGFWYCPGLICLQNKIRARLIFNLASMPRSREWVPPYHWDRCGLQG
ncbi:unnamed protein product [Protopolystoma xenopodis]|uniref:Ig-like domain-containing protein n=1 Tax=Protopolystoma xenopodis TaxID=117903 RepID=A0A3S4ZUS1_9PLAT|nr:unnamed protein product [Protopolystoma xenopodis]